MNKQKNLNPELKLAETLAAERQAAMAGPAMLPTGKV